VTVLRHDGDWTSTGVLDVSRRHPPLPTLDPERHAVLLVRVLECRTAVVLVGKAPDEIAFDVQFGHLVPALEQGDDSGSV
jgi:hypothetical protein